MLLYSIPLGKYATGEPFPGGGHLGCFQVLFSFTVLLGKFLNVHSGMEVLVT